MTHLHAHATSLARLPFLLAACGVPFCLACLTVLLWVGTGSGTPPGRDSWLYSSLRLREPFGDPPVLVSLFIDHASPH